MGSNPTLSATPERQVFTIGWDCVHCGPQLAPLAQLDRASGYGPEGRGFESLGARCIKDVTRAVGMCDARRRPGDQMVMIEGRISILENVDDLRQIHQDLESIS